MKVTKVTAKELLKNPLGRIKLKNPDVKSVQTKKNVRTPASSNIKRYAYDETTRLFAVQFMNNRIYEIPNVLPQFVKGMDRAVSKGKYYEKWLRHGPAKEVKHSKLLRSK